MEKEEIKKLLRKWYAMGFVSGMDIAIAITDSKPMKGKTLEELESEFEEDLKSSTPSPLRGQQHGKGNT